MSKLYGIGLGPGDPDLLSLKAVKRLAETDVIAVPYSKSKTKSIALNIAKIHLKKETEILWLHFPMLKNDYQRSKTRKANYELIKQKLDENKDVAFITLGDPLFYSTFNYILNMMDKENVEIIPGITSMNSSATTHKIPLTLGNENLTVVTDPGNFTPELFEKKHTFVFMKVSAYPKKLYDIIIQQGWKDYFFMVTASSTSRQHLSRRIDDLLNTRLNYMTTVIIRKQHD